MKVPLVSPHTGLRPRCTLLGKCRLSLCGVHPQRSWFPSGGSDYTLSTLDTETWNWASRSCRVWGLGLGNGPLCRQQRELLIIRSLESQCVWRLLVPCFYVPAYFPDRIPTLRVTQTMTRLNTQKQTFLMLRPLRKIKFYLFPDYIL